MKYASETINSLEVFIKSCCNPLVSNIKYILHKKVSRRVEYPKKTLDI